MAKNGGAFSGNDSSPVGNNTNVTASGAHTVKGIGRVQRAAAKRITGAAAVGAEIDSRSQSNMFPTGKAPRIKLGKYTKHTVRDAVPSDKRTS